MSSGPAHLKKVMTEIVENKCVQVERLREKLRSANFAESTYNDTWGLLNRFGVPKKEIMMSFFSLIQPGGLTNNCICYIGKSLVDNYLLYL